MNACLETDAAPAIKESDLLLPEKKKAKKPPPSLRLDMVSPRQLAPADIVLGTTCIGPGGGDNGDGSRPDPGQPNADALVAAAIDGGIRDFDTAPWYGSGTSEERLGRAVQTHPEARVMTKVGRRFYEADGTTPAGSDQPFDEEGYDHTSRACENDYSAEGALLSHADSLKRLGLPAVFGLR